jgi:hypothetical protein
MKQYPAKVCQVCGKTWQPMNRYQSTRNKTCGKVCLSNLISRSRTGRRKATSALVEVSCSVCGKPIKRWPRSLARTASPTCSYECNGVLRGKDWAQHGHKGRSGWTDASRESAKAKMSGPNNPAWKGGVTYRKGKGNYVGPRYVRSPKWATPMARKDGYVMEHRLVMAQRIGRLLERSEVVNHINHDPRDNRLENLELYPSNGDHKRGEAGRYATGAANHWSPRQID